MKHWDLGTLPVEPHRPEVLHSEGEGRSILINLPAGEQLSDHQVHERAWLLVVEGDVEIVGSETVTGGSGLLVVFEPTERREVRAVSAARLLLLLAPWPGVGREGSAA